MKKDNLKENIPDSVIDKVSKSTGIDASKLKKDLLEGNTKNILNNLKGKDAEKFKKIMNNPELTKKILNSPQAQTLLKKFAEKHK